MSDSPKWQIGWGYTSACDMRCPFCYSRTVRQHPQETPLDLAMAFVRNNAASIASINYGTGECALSKNWFTLVRSIRSQYPEIRQALTTNGSVYRQVASGAMDGADLFSAIDEIDVSLDFADASKHNAMRGKEDAYTGALGTLALCATHRRIPTIVTVAFPNTLTRENLDGLFALAGEYGAFVRLNILRPVEGVAFAPPEYEELLDALQYITKRYSVVSLCDPLFGALFGAPVQYGDSAGVTSLRILPDGSITPSTYLITPEWRAERLSESLDLTQLAQLPPFHSIQSASLPEECQDCSLGEHCAGGAIDRRILYYRSLSERDPYCPSRHGFRAEPASGAVRAFRGTLRPTVHDGYLPTMIFSPTEGVEP